MDKGIIDNEKQLTDIFSEVGEGYKYDKVNATFVAYRDFKVKWTRSYRWAEFQISDYLNDAPAEVIRGLADTLFARISGINDRDYPKEMTDWITSPEFTRKKQPVYLKRSRNITRNPSGEYRNLIESLDRLKAQGLVRKDVHPFLTWTKEPLQSMVGYCSTLMDTIAVSSVFDTDTIADYVLDYVVYHEYLITQEGWVRFGKGDEDFDLYEEERKFPQWKEAENCINRLCLRF